MEPIKLSRALAGAMFILIGLSVGIGLNLGRFPFSVIGAPNPPLTSVAHDTTLTGTGMASAPLGVANTGIGASQLANNAVTNAKIANGAITAPKLGTAAAPSAGQVLGFNGTGLAWQAGSVGGSGGPRVVDSLGNTVGPYYDHNDNYQTAIILLNGIYFQIPVSKQGFKDFNTGSNFLYPTSDCSGPAYMTELDPSWLTVPALSNVAISNGILYYPGAGTPQQFTAGSYSGSPPPLPQDCQAYGSMVSAVPYTSINLSTLGFVQPFHIELQ
jgi:hypothetical protein